jgi:hypothetical protein
VDPKEKIRTFWPAVLVLIILTGYVLYRLSINHWDPVELAEIGTIYQNGDENGSEGYDGQFAYYIAINPDPDKVSIQLDVPAYRYQRILYPLLARFLSFAQTTYIPWALIILNILSQVLGTAILCTILSDLLVPVRYSLIYGLWAGLVIGVGTDLYEPLTFSLILAAILARLKGKTWLTAIFLTCSMFAKETAILFWAAMLLADFTSKKRKSEILIALIPGIFYGIWQGFLYYQFGSFGLGSGGAMATPFEWIPFGGFFRIASAGVEVLVLYAVIFGPTIILPDIWGIMTSLRFLFKRRMDFETLALLLNTLFITFLPFSTFREPLGLIRVSTGMVLTTIILAAKYGMRRPLNLGMFWIALLATLVE